MNEHDRINLSQLAVFPVNEQGRAMLAGFLKENRLIEYIPGEMVNDSKREPCLWVRYLPGLDPYMSQKNESVEKEPKKPKQKKITHNGCN